MKLLLIEFPAPDLQNHRRRCPQSPSCVAVATPVSPFRGWHDLPFDDRGNPGFALNRFRRCYSVRAIAGSGNFFHLPGLRFIQSARSVSSAACVEVPLRPNLHLGSSSRTSTSVGAFLSGPSYCSGSISVSDTSAIPVGCRSRVPAKNDVFHARTARVSSR